ncbi:MAG: hypothetical protein L3J42_04900 [Hydrogenimonas sp.]|nr:hypothetical protein [Hydrogenimonas sp.]
MHKILLFLACATLLFGAVEEKNVQILAASVERDGNVVTATGDVVVYYGDKILQADRARYDSNSSVLELFGDVEMMEGLKMASFSEYVKLELKNDSDSFDDIFISDLQTRLWMRGDKAKKRADRVTLAKAFVSSCDVVCPDWHMEFTTLDYNMTTKWLNIWNPILYMKDTPVLYFPYIGFSTDRERRSGLLRPYFGVSSRDGFFYTQPIYFAPDPQWDLQIDPQIRAARGSGVFATFRFVDSPHSRGKVTTGYFIDNLSFVKEYNLRNRSHYGLQANYESSRVFSSQNSGEHDGLYVDITYLKDPDYKNLQAYTTSELANSSQVQSRINYYYNTPNYYGGIYGKYFIDTSLASNKNTVQSIPVIQLHRYQNKLLGWNALHYSADYRLSNFFTGAGKHIQLQEINAPLIFYTNFLDGYLNLSVSENLYYSYIGYQNLPSDAPGSYYSFFRNYHKIDLFSDIAKRYGENFHTLQMRITYNRPSFSNEKGYIDPSISVLRSPNENMVISAINYLYDSNAKEFFYYRISQPVLYEKSDHKYGDIENEFKIKFFKNYELYSNLFYSYYMKSLSGATSHIKYSKPGYDIMLTHFYKVVKDEKSSDFFTVSGTYRSESGNDWFARVSYDNLDRKVRRWETGVHFFRHCWDLNLGVKDEKRPILTSAGAQSIDNLVFYFQINLVPLGGFEQRFEQEF